MSGKNSFPILKVLRDEALFDQVLQALKSGNERTFTESISDSLSIADGGKLTIPQFCENIESWILGQIYEFSKNTGNSDSSGSTTTSLSNRSGNDNGNGNDNIMVPPSSAEFVDVPGKSSIAVTGSLQECKASQFTAIGVATKGLPKKAAVEADPPGTINGMKLTIKSQISKSHRIAPSVVATVTTVNVSKREPAAAVNSVSAAALSASVDEPIAVLSQEAVNAWASSNSSTVLSAHYTTSAGAAMGVRHTQKPKQRVTVLTPTVTAGAPHATIGSRINCDNVSLGKSPVQPLGLSPLPSTALVGKKDPMERAMRTPQHSHFSGSMQVAEWATPPVQHDNRANVDASSSSSEARSYSETTPSPATVTTNSASSGSYSSGAFNPQGTPQLLASHAIRGNSSSGQSQYRSPQVFQSPLLSSLSYLSTSVVVAASSASAEQLAHIENPVRRLGIRQTASLYAVAVKNQYVPVTRAIVMLFDIANFLSTWQSAEASFDRPSLVVVPPLVTSNDLEGTVAIRLQKEYECDSAADSNSDSDHSYGNTVLLSDSCVAQFLVCIVEELGDVVRHMGAFVLKSLLSLDFFVKRGDEELIKNLQYVQEECEAQHAMDVQMAESWKPTFHDDLDSRNFYKDKIDAKLYNLREKLFDSFHKEFQRFEDSLIHDNKSLSSYSVSLELLEQLSGMRDVSIPWIADRFVDMLAFYGVKEAVPAKMDNRRIVGLLHPEASNDSPQAIAPDLHKQQRGVNYEPPYLKRSRPVPHSNYHSKHGNSTTPLSGGHNFKKTDLSIHEMYREIVKDFPGYQLFFFWVIIQFDNHRFSQCLQDALSHAIFGLMGSSVLGSAFNDAHSSASTAMRGVGAGAAHTDRLFAENDPIASSADSSQSTSRLVDPFILRIAKMKVLGKFWGLLTFWHSWTLSLTAEGDISSGPSALLAAELAKKRHNVLRAHAVSTSQQPTASVFIPLLEQAWCRRMLVLVVPWVTQYLEMMRWDGVSHLNRVYAETFQFLAGVLKHEMNQLVNERQHAPVSTNRLFVIMEIQSLFEAIPQDRFPAVVTGGDSVSGKVRKSIRPSNLLESSPQWDNQNLALSLVFINRILPQMASPLGPLSAALKSIESRRTNSVFSSSSSFFVANSSSTLSLKSASPTTATSPPLPPPSAFSRASVIDVSTTPVKVLHSRPKSNSISSSDSHNELQSHINTSESGGCAKSQQHMISSPRGSDTAVFKYSSSSTNLSESSGNSSVSPGLSGASNHSHQPPSLIARQFSSTKSSSNKSPASSPRRANSSSNSGGKRLSLDVIPPALKRQSSISSATSVGASPGGKRPSPVKGSFSAMAGVGRSLQRTNSNIKSPMTVPAGLATQQQMSGEIGAMLENAFWQQHPELQKISDFIVDGCRQARLLRCKERVGEAVRELWSLSEVTKSQMLAHSAHREQPQHQATRASDAFKLEVKDEAVKLYQRVEHDGGRALVGFVETYLPSFDVLYDMIPKNPHVKDLAKHLTRRRVEQQYHDLMRYFTNYLDRKLEDTARECLKDFEKTAALAFRHVSHHQEQAQNCFQSGQMTASMGVVGDSDEGDDDVFDEAREIYFIEKTLVRMKDISVRLETMFTLEFAPQPLDVGGDESSPKLLRWPLCNPASILQSPFFKHASSPAAIKQQSPGVRNQLLSFQHILADHLFEIALFLNCLSNLKEASLRQQLSSLNAIAKYEQQISAEVTVSNLFEISRVYLRWLRDLVKSLPTEHACKIEASVFTTFVRALPSMVMIDHLCQSAVSPSAGCPPIKQINRHHSSSLSDSNDHVVQWSAQLVDVFSGSAYRKLSHAAATSAISYNFVSDLLFYAMQYELLSLPAFVQLFITCGRDTTPKFYESCKHFSNFKKVHSMLTVNLFGRFLYWRRYHYDLECYFEAENPKEEEELENWYAIPQVRQVVKKLVGADLAGLMWKFTKNW